MKLIDASIEILDTISPEMLKLTEKAIRNCYLSEDKITEDSYLSIHKKIVDSHHFSTLEHCKITVKITCSRACMAQWTRHRLFSFSIQSQRYVNYSKDKFGGEIKFIKPVDHVNFTKEQEDIFIESCEAVETLYFKRLNAGFKAEDARGVLSNDVATTMVITGNLRVWREFLEKRMSKSAQKEIRHLSNLLLTQFKANIPVIFEGIDGN